MPAWGWIVLGLLLPHAPALHALPWSATATLAFALLLVPFRVSRSLALMSLGAAWTLHAMELRREGRLEEPLEAVTVIGVVEGLPEISAERARFRLRAERAEQAPGLEGEALLLIWYAPFPDLHPGQRWELALRLKPPRGRVNLAGPDFERWLMNEGFAAVGAVTGAGGRLLGTEARLADELRDRIRRSLQVRLAGHEGLGLVQALAIAERSALAPELRDTLRVTGTGHLLAISGLHVGMVAWLAFGLGRVLLLPAAAGRRAGTLQDGCWVLGLAAASGYAMLAGFGVSTQRALVMLAVLCAARWTRRQPSPWQGLALAALFVLLLDPLAPSRAGAWMSFAAVAVLFHAFVPRPGRRGPLGTMLLAQAAISLCLLPLSLLWFEQAGPGGLAANLVAIPWVSLVTLPLVLACLSLLPFEGPLPEIVAAMAAGSATWLTQMLQALSDGFADRLFLRVGTVSWLAASAATLGALLLFLPRGLPARWSGLMLLAPLFLPRAPFLAEGAVRLQLLDVGQGLAVLVETRKHLLLYDTGPGLPGQWDLVAPVIEPALRRAGRRPDRVIVSHGDLDHAGGADRLRRLFPEALFLGNLPPGRRQLTRCDDRRYWRWDGVRFEVLHPSPWLPYLGNDSSCVVSVTAAGGSVLLPGDVSERVERRLASEPRSAYAAVLAPHHGSRTSTGPGFLSWAQPAQVLVPAGVDNRFGFPHADVLARLDALGIPAWSTANCGALTLELAPDGEVTTRSARRQRPGWWRWPAGAECP